MIDVLKIDEKKLWESAHCGCDTFKSPSFASSLPEKIIW